jgi:hypothetical protein
MLRPGSGRTQSIRLQFPHQFHLTAASLATSGIHLAATPDTGLLVMLAPSKFRRDARFLALLFEALEDAVNGFVALNNYKTHRNVPSLLFREWRSPNLSGRHKQWPGTKKAGLKTCATTYPDNRSCQFL